MRFLLRPGWIALIVAVVGFVFACYTYLAPWQFGREAERDAQQHAIDTSTTAAPEPLAQLVPGPTVGPDVDWRQVSLTGTYLPDAETLVRLRVVDGKPAFEVLTPLRSDDGRTVVVDRGSIATTDGRTVPDYAAPPAGPVSLTGRLRVNETDPQNRPVFTGDTHRQMYAADSRPIAAASGLDIVAGYVALGPGQPGVLDPIEIAPNTGGAPFSNLSYALQWLTFGAIALIALGYFIRLEILQRRSGRRSQFDGANFPDHDGAVDGSDDQPEDASTQGAEHATSDTPGPDPDGHDAAADDQAVAAPRETPLADRYGRR